MFLIVSNINHVYNAFFRAIPYGGPQVQLMGYPPYTTVSNAISLQATITDLTGVSNDQFQVTIDGVPAKRYSFISSNIVRLNTRYSNTGLRNIYLNVNNSARVCNPTNPPIDSQLTWTGTGSLCLDFENDTYLTWDNDYCSPDVGSSWVVLHVSEPQDIEAWIWNPATGDIAAYYYNYVPYPANMGIPWNFTQADGSPYTNDTYVVTFTAYGSGAMANG